MSVVLRTHGGLGNQIFQILYGRLFADKFNVDLKVIHDIRYQHAFPLSNNFQLYTQHLTTYQKLISSLRLPKVLQRLTQKSESVIWLFNTAYLDGYFQNNLSYTIFKKEEIARNLRILADQLSIPPADLEQCLVHLRVGDFFKSRSDAREFVTRKLSMVSASSSIMTNDEELLAEPEVVAILEARSCKVVASAGYPAEEVLRMMARYRQIDANDSTMVFWASVLGGCRVELRNAELRATQNLFLRCLVE